VHCAAQQRGLSLLVVVLRISTCVRELARAVAVGVDVDAFDGTQRSASPQCTLRCCLLFEVRSACATEVY
jgi:NADH:ubiquinone oxidoreductase subunit B-like Fe-S oxidoreductase